MRPSRLQWAQKRLTMTITVFDELAENRSSFSQTVSGNIKQ